MVYPETVSSSGFRWNTHPVTDAFVRYSAQLAVMRDSPKYNWR